MQAQVSSRRQEGLKVLVRVEGQGNSGQPLGPWALDVEQRSMEEVTLMINQVLSPSASSSCFTNNFSIPSAL